MDVSSIATANMYLSNASLMAGVNIEMMSKVLEAEELQEQALTQMISAVDTSRLLDTYA